MKTKSTKKALLASLLSLVVCVSMLVGTTFAWFTDSVTSANNIIKSGNLDVTMEWKDATTTGKQLTYKDASTGAIFNYDLWEPGYVEAKNVKISNVGSLALKYNVNIVANGEVSALADVIDVFFAEGEYILADREMTELTKIGTLREVLAGTPANMTGDLTAGNSDIVTIALKMRETAGNEYQGLSIGTDFSVILMATQDNVEFDSFDENYDDIDVPNKDIKVIDGNTYYYYNNGVVALREVPYGNVGTTFTVPDGVTVIGIAKDKNDTDGPVFSKYSSVESITLPEGVTEINARAINMKTLTSINFPSTLTYIGEQAFRQTGMSELTIPANVKVIDEGAFRDMANLETVTIEGNVNFDNYAFRSCPNLESIYLLGDDVTFSGSQFATHSDNGDATGITIYVKNATVAARVYAAQTSAYGYEVKILGDAVDGSDAGEVVKATNQTALQDAVANEASAVVLSSGTYSIPTGMKSGQEVTIAGTKDTIIKNTGIAYPGGSTVNFTGVTINSSGYGNGMGNGVKATYTDCTFNAADMYLYGSAKFINCTFNDCGTYALWTWGAGTAEFVGCTFNTTGKALYVNANVLDNGTNHQTVKITDCKFYDTGANNTQKAAIETGDDYNKTTYDIIITNTIVEGFAVTEDKTSSRNYGGNDFGTNVWGNKYLMGTDKLNVVINGVDVH